MAEEKEKPLTREDVLRLIQENGGKAEGLDLSGANLSGLDLHGIILKGANLTGADLRDAFLMGATLANAWLDGAKLQGADLESVELSKASFWEAKLYGADLGGATLRKTDFYNADLREVDFEEVTFEEVDFRGARLQGAYLYAVDIRPHYFRDIELEDVDWGNFILGTEKIREFKEAEVIYRHLKMWHTDRGLYSVAGEFYFREMEARRKAIWSRDYPQLPEEAPRRRKALYQLKRVRDWLWLTTVEGLCGYGERPSKVVLAAAVIIFGLAGLYTAFGSFSSGSFLNCLYYSAVSFTALGYGSWAPQPTGWVKGLGVFEAVMGVFMMALFLVTFTRKMTR